MKHNKSRVACFIILGLLFLLSSGVPAFAQADTEFWFVAPEITFKHGVPGGVPASFRFSTDSLAATIQITMPANRYDAVSNPNGFRDTTFTMPAYSFSIFDVRKYIVKPDNSGDVSPTRMENKPLTPSGINPFGIHIISTETITAYYEIGNTYNRDIWALKGRNGIGRTFYAPFQTIKRNNSGTIVDTPSAIDVVATRDNTFVTFKLPPGIKASYGKLPSAPFMNNLAAGASYTVKLNKGETFSLFPYNKSSEVINKLAGTKITATQPVAVTVKDDSFYHSIGGCNDTAGDQLITADVIGKEYAVIRTKLDYGDATDHIYVLATEPSTSVSFYNQAGTLVRTVMLNSQQQHYERLVAPNMYYRVVATKPVYVWHIGGFGCEVGGAVLPPIDQCTGVTNVAFARTSSSDFYVVMMVRKGAEDKFIFNGVPQKNTGAPNETIFKPSQFVEIPGSQWSVACYGTFPTSGAGGIPAATALLMRNTKDVFHLGIVNGGSTSGCYFGYFSNYNVFKAQASVGTLMDNQQFICYGDNIQLRAGGGVNYVWTANAMPDFLDNHNIPNPWVLDAKATRKYTVKTSGACNMVDSASVTVNVADPLDAAFTASSTIGCGTFEVNFSDSTIGNVTTLRWYVKEVDGTSGYGTCVKAVNLTVTPEDTTFNHTFVNTSSDTIRYIVTLIAKSMGCTKVVRRGITSCPEFFINPTYIIDPANPNHCSPVKVRFKINRSGGYNGPLIYKFKFGDGTDTTFTSTAIPGETISHTYHHFTTVDTVAKFTPILTADTPSGSICPATSVMTPPIEIQPYLKANFSVNPIESCSPLNTTVINNSFGGISNYKWEKMVMVFLMIAPTRTTGLSMVQTPQQLQLKQQ